MIGRVFLGSACVHVVLYLTPGACETVTGRPDKFRDGYWKRDPIYLLQVSIIVLHVEAYLDYSLCADVHIMVM